MWQRVTGLVYAICGVVLGLFALLIFITKFDEWDGWGLYIHLIMFSMAVGSIACIKAARVSLAARDERRPERIGPRG